MGGAVSSGENNDDLVDNLISASYIKSPSVERVFRAVDRASYYTDEDRGMAYKDVAWKSKNLHLSAPCIYSQVVESLELKEGIRFLNLGSGTGYLSTMVGLFLGPYGINHGLEIHADVIDYAQEKLQEFIQFNPAIDEYDFCIPQFEQGNCLSLAATDRRYDRIYCGAACPESYNDCIKQLVEVGGILVMPVNDQLLQIKRKTLNEWEVNSVLPVSFASLILPQEVTEDSVLPPFVPQNLMELCRYKIRSILKRKIDREHPDLWQRNRKHPKDNYKRSVTHRCFVPVFANTDSDSDTAADMEVDGHENDDYETHSESSSDSEIENQELSSDRRIGVRLAETLSDTEDLGGKSKREKFDSGVNELSESRDEQSTSPSSVELNERPTTSQNTTNYPLERNESIQESARQEPRERRRRPNMSGIRLFSHSRGDGERAALVVFQSPIDPDSDSTDQNDSSDKNEELDSSQVSPPENYSYYIKQSLTELPLPYKLKCFLNYGRAF